MKWFRHECSAKYDPKLQVLGEEFGAEGIGVYWMLLEEIGHHSDTFHFKVTGASAEADQAYADALLHREGPLVSICNLAGANVPRMPLKTLARILFTTDKRLQRVIEKSVEVGLFDDTKWRTYGLLYSPAFEHHADDYTRRRRRSTDYDRTNPERSRDNVRARSERSLETVGHGSDSAQSRDEISPDNVRTHSERSPASVGHEPEALQQRDSTSPNNVPPEQTTEQKEIQKERQKQKEKEIEEEKKLCSIQAEFELSTAYPHPGVYESDAETVPVPSAENFAVASAKQRIQNPFGCKRSCTHGTPEGMPPWVHLTTAVEEAERITSPRSPP